MEVGKIPPPCMVHTFANQAIGRGVDDRSVHVLLYGMSRSVIGSRKLEVALWEFNLPLTSIVYKIFRSICV